MVNRSLFPSLCKTFLAVCLLFTAPCPANPQIVANAPAQPATARASFGAPAEKLKLAGVSNAGKVSEMLFRGAQPSVQGLAELKKLGVTTIVDLRGNSGPVAWERAQAESLGMRFVNIPVLGWSAPDNAKVAQFLKLVQQEPQEKNIHPLLLRRRPHGRHGRHLSHRAAKLDFGPSRRGNGFSRLPLSLVSGNEIVRPQIPRQVRR